MIKNLIQEYKGRLISTTLLSAMSSIISIYLLAQINEKIAISSPAQIYSAIPIFLLMVLSLFAISFISQILLARLGTSFVFELRNVLLKKTINVNYENLEKIGSHKILASITTDVANISMSLAVLPVFAVNLSTIVFCFIYLSLKSMALFGFLILSLIVSAVISVFVMKKGRSYFVLFREQEDKMFSSFKTLIDGSKELNINQNRRNYFYNKQAKPNISDVRATEIKAKFYWVFSENMISSLLFLILGLLLFAGHVLLDTDMAILTAFILFTTYLISPLLFIQSAFQTLIKGHIAVKKIDSLKLSENKDLIDASSKVSNDWGSLVFENVKYTYPATEGYQFSVGPIDLSISQGETLFVCGGNGSGKSTFAKLLSGLYENQQGKLIFAGETISTANKQWYRNHFSTIFSDFFLFENVLDDRGQLVSNSAISEYLKQMKLEEKVEIKNNRLTTTQLSQGQRKRLAMVIARLEDSSIYLFDEWAADQDPMFRDYFYMELIPELKRRGKTLIVITHDDKYFHTADRIIEFENGTVKEKNHINDIKILKHTTNTL